MAFAMIFRKFRQLSRDKQGVAAVEFAFSAPMLVLGVVVMTDLGLAIQERMNLDQAIRAGAEFAMNDISNEDDLRNLVLASANGSYSSGDEDLNDVDPYATKAVVPPRRCECPEAPGTSVSCSGTLCANNLPPSVYYDISASKKYNAMFIPDITLNTEITVQIR